MARPTQNGTTGKEWSLRQVAMSADIGMRTARTLVAGGWLPAEGLHREHVAIARVAAALLVAPRPTSEGRGPLSPSLTARYREIIAHVYSLLADPNPDAVVLLAPDGYVVGKQLMSSLGFFVEVGKGQPVMVIPVGQWVSEVQA